MSSKIKTLISLVKKEENYIPRNYQTIGGMWTVDTWKKNDVMVQVMDEGYTTAILAPGLKIMTGYNGKEFFDYELGDESMVDKLIQQIS